MTPPRDTSSASGRMVPVAALAALVLAAVAHLGTLPALVADASPSATAAEMVGSATSAGDAVRIDEDGAARPVAPVAGVALLLAAAMAATPAGRHQVRPAPVPLRTQVRGGRWGRRAPPA